MTEFISKEKYILAATAVVVSDMVMSFFGSMGSDAGFNSWINDMLNNENRGQIGGALATQPLIGMMLATLVGGILIGNENNYMRLFLVMGLFVTGFGGISLFALNKSNDITPSIRGTFWQQFSSVFNFSRFVKMKELLLINIGIAVAFSGFNIFFAYIGNYIIYYLGYQVTDLALIEAIPLLLAMLSAIPMAKQINKDRHPYTALFGVACCVVGLLLMWPITPQSVNTGSVFQWRLWLGIFICGSGYIAILQTTKVWAKQLYPPDSRGQFEGIWVVFFVLIPMLLGSFLGGLVVKTSGEQFLNEITGRMEYIPNGMIFLSGAICILLSAIPFTMTIKLHNDRVARLKLVETETLQTKKGNCE